MRITICELPHEPKSFNAAWTALCEHTIAHASQLVVLPEFAAVSPVWESARFDAARWGVIETLSQQHLRRLPELGAEYVMGTRPACVNDLRLNQAYLWSSKGIQTLRSKFFIPDEPGNWEATWFDRGDPGFPTFRVGPISFGVNICTELWALETYAAYAALGVQLVLAPRATALATTAKWLAAGVAGAVRSGAFNVSSNRVDPSGACGGGGWIIDPDGELLAFTSAAKPFITLDVDLIKAASAKERYPRYVFSQAAASR